MTTAPYGSWPSPITAADVARAGLGLAAPAVVGDEVWWTEGRPAEGGRLAVVRRGADGDVHDVLTAPWSARTRVHEYGGASWLAVAGGSMVFANYADQRVYRLDPASEPVPLTPEPDRPGGLRYADPVDGADGEVWWVRESHVDGKVRRHIVSVPLDGSGEVREIVGGSDFLAFPRRSPDGTRIAWIAWDHPRMPWDGTELRVADVSADGTATAQRTLLGGPEESVMQPEWAGDGSLYVVSDRSGWWNLYRVPLSGEAQPLCPREEEFSEPLWQLGHRTYALLADGRLVVQHGDRLGVLDPASGALADHDLPYTVLGGVHSDGRTVATVAGSPTAPTAIVRIDPDGTAVELRRAYEDVPAAGYLPAPRAITVPGVSGREVHAVVYPPSHPTATAPTGELPPYVVWVHGGPTSCSPMHLRLAMAYFTSRGIGILDVDYGGSSGYGRAYRDRLQGQWGVVDVEDCVSAAQALAAEGVADGARLAIRGGSAGGWTTLAALTRTDAFAAGVSLYGVAELQQFSATTHDFESRYLDGLIGPLPEASDLYVQRAPLSHVDGLSTPVLLLQGAEDPVVLPAQAEMFRDALVRKGIPHAYLVFEGEQHGFRRAENQITALEAELSFYGQVFGFAPDGVPVLELTS